MGLSETILAAMIGAAATVGTALFQLLGAFRAKGRTDIKPKRGTTLRSIIAITALMVASAAGGFLYSQFLQQRAGEDIRAMRQELRELRDLTASRVLERSQPQQFADVAAPESAMPVPEPHAIPISLEPESGVAESIAYVPACRVAGASDCPEAQAQRIALCGTVPAHARVETIHFFAQPDAVQHPWDQHAVALEADVGGAKFSGNTFEYAQGPAAKAVCVNFMQWSSQHPHIARIVVQYSTGSSTEVATPGTSEASPAVETTIAGSDPFSSAVPAALTSSTTALR
ncbi:MAG TPA: hypothetical protein PKE27_02920 [Povalibacter sp.]|uniref:hypothetical protein n=1 Tax=Povalibacter sp. TaxID=1962978 RepID=UPI002CB02DC8|nr:hypothetical protein [Povalibacter sp.]HMN43494.1 hypothetical protein [Povalibacter sp.]